MTVPILNDGFFIDCVVEVTESRKIAEEENSICLPFCNKASINEVLITKEQGFS